MDSNSQLIKLNDIDSDVINNNSSMPDALNVYFNKRLFENYNDFEEKQKYNFKLSNRKYIPYDSILTKRVRFLEKSKTKYFSRKPIFNSNNFGNREYKFNDFVEKMEEGIYVMIYYFRRSYDNGKHYKPKEGHMVIIEKFEDDLIEIKSNDGNETSILPFINFDLNEKKEVNKKKK